MKTQQRKGYFFAFFHVQMAIAALVLIPYTLLPPSMMETFLPRILLFFVLLVAGSVSIVDRRRLVLLLQIIAALGMLACLAVVFTIPPLGPKLFDALGVSPRSSLQFGRATAVCMSASPFNLVWLLDEMAYPGPMRGILISVFRGNRELLYYLHAAVGFVFWLLDLFFVSADEDGRTGDDPSFSSQDGFEDHSSYAQRTEPVDGRLRDLYVFFKQHLAKSLAGLERRRKAVASALLQTHVYFSLTIIFCGVFGWHAAMEMLDKERGFGFAFFIIMILWVVGLSFYWPFSIPRDKKDYVRDFKKRIIEQLVGFVDKSLVYESERKIGLDRFLAGGIFRATPSSYEGEDYVSGVIGGRSLAFSELRVDQRIGRNYVTIFKGLYFVLESDRSFAGETYVLPISAGGTLGRSLTVMFRSWNKARGQLVATENPEFDRFFTVHSTAPEEARHVLNHEFLESVTAYRANNPLPIYFSFVRNEVHAALHYRKLLFEPPVYRTAVDFDMIARHFEDLRRAMLVAGLAV